MNNQHYPTMQTEDTTILVCCHKKDYCYDGEGFMPIHVGKAAHPDIDLGIPGDDTGDNISIKNPNYCELTAHYWYWKNGQRTKYVGLNHYRRYFLFTDKLTKWIPDVERTPEYMAENPPILSNLDEIFAKYDIVLARPLEYRCSIGHSYKLLHITEDYDIMRNAIKQCYPEYLESFDKTMGQNLLSPCNMFITTDDVFQQYSTWLFSLLNEIEKHVKISEYPVQSRVYGYMAERLLNVYVHHNNMHVFYAPIIKIDDNPTNRKPQNFIRHWVASKLHKFTTRYLDKK